MFYLQRSDRLLLRPVSAITPRWFQDATLRGLVARKQTRLELTQHKYVSGFFQGFMVRFGSISLQDQKPIYDDFTPAWDRLDTGKIRKRQVTGASLVNEGRLDEHY